MTPDENRRRFRAALEASRADIRDQIEARIADGTAGQASPLWDLRPVPNTPGTPRRTIRVPNRLWEAAQAKAEAEGTDVSAVIRKALERYVRRSK